METAKTSSFEVGETITPAGLEATFRILSAGAHGMRITRTSHAKIVPKKPYTVTLKGVLFKIVGWSGREFTIHRLAQIAKDHGPRTEEQS